MGYKWPFYYMAIFAGISFVFLFFFMEETNYDRGTVGVIYSNGNENANNSGGDVSTTTGEVAASISKPIPVDVEKQASDTTAHGAILKGEEKTFWEKLTIWDKPRPFLMHWRAWQSLRLISWPVVFFAGFSYGSYLIWFNVLNATASVVLGAPPYNFKPSTVGLTYLSCIVGVCIG